MSININDEKLKGCDTTLSVQESVILEYTIYEELTQIIYCFFCTKSVLNPNLNIAFMFPILLKKKNRACIKGKIKQKRPKKRVLKEYIMSIPDLINHIYWL